MFVGGAVVSLAVREYHPSNTMDFGSGNVCLRLIITCLISRIDFQTCKYDFEPSS